MTRKDKSRTMGKAHPPPVTAVSLVSQEIDEEKIPLLESSTISLSANKPKQTQNKPHHLKRPSLRNIPKLPHHARAPLPEPFPVMVLAVHSAQAREVHFGFDHWVYRANMNWSASHGSMSIVQSSREVERTDAFGVHFLAHVVRVAEDGVVGREVVVGGPGEVV